MDPICREMVAWKSISGIVPALNNPDKLGRARQGMAGSSRGLRDTVEKQFPDAAWISWEFYKNIPIFFDSRPQTPAGLFLGFAQITQTCSAGSSFVLP